jgi:uncharacterized coiled-coil DUF342 family protein
MKPDYAKLYEQIYTALGTPKRREWLKALEAAALDLEREDRYEFRNVLRAKHLDTLARLRAENRELRARLNSVRAQRDDARIEASELKWKRDDAAALTPKHPRKTR